jgi:hypothetical protein
MCLTPRADVLPAVQNHTEYGYTRSEVFLLGAAATVQAVGVARKVELGRATAHFLRLAIARGPRAAFVEITCEDLKAATATFVFVKFAGVASNSKPRRLRRQGYGFITPQPYGYRRTSSRSSLGV